MNFKEIFHPLGMGKRKFLFFKNKSKQLFQSLKGAIL